MILADTSVWIDHLRQEETQFSGLLKAEEVLMHTMVLGELALGSLKGRAKVLHSLALLPPILVARDLEVRTLIETSRLHGRGIGYVDAHLLTAALLTPGTTLWTRDKRLLSAAVDAKVAAPYL